MIVRSRVHAVLVALLLSLGLTASARAQQAPLPQPLRPAMPATTPALPAAAGAPALDRLPQIDWTSRALPPPRTATLADPFRHVGGDLARFLSTDTARIVAMGGAVAVMAHPFDRHFVEESREHLRPRGRFDAGNIGGSFLVQTGGAFATLAIGQFTDSPRIASLGADLVRAQFVSQAVVQGVKFATGRTRPDGSNRFAFPSGHTASAAATATVLQQHFGWKAGVPAYAFAAYVASSRMAADKHHLSDVLMGAAIGIAAGRTVTMGVGRTRFDVGVTPTVGGAAVMFTKR